jgi:hypothetical protein
MPAPSTRQIACLVLVLIAAGCRREDPARAALRTRLTEAQPLSSDELGRVRSEISKTIQAEHVRVQTGAESRDLTAEEQTVVLGMLTEPAGMFDEGLREESGERLRVLNAPGLSEDPEIEATRRLWIDVVTFRPRRFSFNYAVPGRGDYALDLR